MINKFNVSSARIKRLDENGEPMGEWQELPGVTSIEFRYAFKPTTAVTHRTFDDTIAAIEAWLRQQ